MSAILSVILPVAAFLVGMGIGPLGLALVPLEAVLATLPLLTLLIAILFGLLGLRLGRGLLRLPPGEILKRSLPPLVFAAVMLLAGTAALPRLLAPLEREFERFHLPLAVTLASLALLSIRDLRTRPPADVGSLFLVAIGLLGAVHSFAPTFVWNQHLDHGVIWRGPVLVLGESGALG
ncbi:MAG: hypothetical protein KC591_14725, partial [Gemmatimonadetes bacterium]|nr:hypothetical protein [Gemmatimonadota bacterium]